METSTSEKEEKLFNLVKDSYARGELSKEEMGQILAPHGISADNVERGKDFSTIAKGLGKNLINSVPLLPQGYQLVNDILSKYGGAEPVDIKQNMETMDRNFENLGNTSGPIGNFLLDSADVLTQVAPAVAGGSALMSAGPKIASRIATNPNIASKLATSPMATSLLESLGNLGGYTGSVGGLAKGAEGASKVANIVRNVGTSVLPMAGLGGAVKGTSNVLDQIHNNTVDPENDKNIVEEFLSGLGRGAVSGATNQIVGNGLTSSLGTLAPLLGSVATAGVKKATQPLPEKGQNALKKVYEELPFLAKSNAEVASKVNNGAEFFRGVDDDLLAEIYGFTPKQVYALKKDGLDAPPVLFEGVLPNFKEIINDIRGNTDIKKVPTADKLFNPNSSKADVYGNQVEEAGRKIGVVRKEASDLEIANLPAETSLPTNKQAGKEHVKRVYEHPKSKTSGSKFTEEGASVEHKKSMTETGPVEIPVAPKSIKLILSKEGVEKLHSLPPEERANFLDSMKQLHENGIESDFSKSVSSIDDTITTEKLPKIEASKNTAIDTANTAQTKRVAKISQEEKALRDAMDTQQLQDLKDKEIQDVGAQKTKLATEKKSILETQAKEEKLAKETVVKPKTKQELAREVQEEQKKVKLLGLKQEIDNLGKVTPLSESHHTRVKNYNEKIVSEKAKAGAELRPDEQVSKQAKEKYISGVKNARSKELTSKQEALKKYEESLATAPEQTAVTPTVKVVAEPKKNPEVEALDKQLKELAEKEKLLKAEKNPPKVEKTKMDLLKEKQMSLQNRKAKLEEYHLKKLDSISSKVELEKQGLQTTADVNKIKLQEVKDKKLLKLDTAIAEGKDATKWGKKVEMQPKGRAILPNTIEANAQFKNELAKNYDGIIKQDYDKLPQQVKLMMEDLETEGVQKRLDALGKPELSKAYADAKKNYSTKKTIQKALESKIKTEGDGGFLKAIDKKNMIAGLLSGVGWVLKESGDNLVPVTAKTLSTLSKSAPQGITRKGNTEVEKLIEEVLIKNLLNKYPERSDRKMESK
jgi:hypothetical protein